MARSELIGNCECPECGFPDAEVRNDKSGHPYRFCPDCTAQYFTRGNVIKVKHLLARVRKPEAPPGAPPQPVASVAPVVPSKEDTAAAVPAKPAAPAKKINSWLPLIGGAS